jgi:transketolase
MMLEDNPDRVPSVTWFKARKGREYLKYDNASHGSPHKINSELFWDTKRPFAEKYDVAFTNFGGSAPDDAAALRAEFEANLKAVMSVLHQDQALVDYLADTLVALGDSVPEEIPAFRLGGRGNPFEDERLYDYWSYPEDVYVEPGTSVANRAALAKWGAWVNAFGAQEYGQPLFVACSADLADSTNVSGFAKGYGDFEGYGWYERYGTQEGVLLPQEITEFANAGILAGMASVNFAPNPEDTFVGFWGAASTYGSFSYLKYGMMRLFSQLAQDCQLRVGKMIWIAGHSGPETADDSRTHFGIFAPGVTQLFPEGSIINLHPWEHNEVPVLLGGFAPDPPAGRNSGPGEAGYGVALRGSAGRVCGTRLSTRPAPGWRLDRTGDQLHGQRPQNPAGPGRARSEREDRLRDQPAAIRASAGGISPAGALAR